MKIITCTSWNTGYLKEVFCVRALSIGSPTDLSLIFQLNNLKLNELTRIIVTESVDVIVRVMATMYSNRRTWSVANDAISGVVTVDAAFCQAVMLSA